MDRQKVRELLKQTHPKHKLVEQNDDASYAADSTAEDVDVSGLSPKTWKKFKTASIKKTSSETSSDLRERFRPRKLTGSGSGGAKPSDAGQPDVARRVPGKLTLESLVPEDAAADSENSLDVLVDEDHGVIGESDS